MHSTYAQTQKTAQKKEASTAAAVLDASSQSEGLQRKADMMNNAAQREEAPRPNNTGMPDNLKSGIESLSGFSMDDVRVHYNSSKPATVQALAYTQGTDIHVAPGQEKHLPHEAWHVAQQMAGRVSPTTNINGMPVNDNAALEHEADIMGVKAAQRKTTFVQRKTLNIVHQNTCQRVKYSPTHPPKKLFNRNQQRNYVLLNDTLLTYYSPNSVTITPLAGEEFSVLTNQMLMKNNHRFTVPPGQSLPTVQSPFKAPKNFTIVPLTEKKVYAGHHMQANLDPRLAPLNGTEPDTSHQDLINAIEFYNKPQKYIQGHLLNNNFGGIGSSSNLAPLSSDANKKHLQLVENAVKLLLVNSIPLTYCVDVVYSSPKEFDVCVPTLTFNCKVKPQKTAKTYTAQIISGPCNSPVSTSGNITDEVYKDIPRLKRYRSFNQQLRKMLWGNALNRGGNPKAKGIHPGARMTLLATYGNHHLK